MFKRYYLYSWIILAAAVFGTVMTESMTGFGMVVYSLIALALVYAFALYAVIVNVPDAEGTAGGYSAGGVQNAS